MYTTREKPITAAQLKALHTWFSRQGWDADRRHGFISTYTGGRTCSTRELTLREAADLLTRLGQEQDERLRAMTRREARALLRSIYYLSLRIPFLNQGFGDGSKEDFEMNKAKLNLWARRYTKCRKDITRMSLEELRDTKRQLEAIARKGGTDEEKPLII